MEDEALARLLAENVAYQAAFKASILVLKDVLPLISPSRESRSAAVRSKEVLSLVRGAFLALPAGLREDLDDVSNQILRAKLRELLAISSLCFPLSTRRETGQRQLVDKLEAPNKFSRGCPTPCAVPEPPFVR